MFKKYLFDICILIISSFTLFPILTGNNYFRIAVVISSIIIFSISLPSLLRARDIPFGKLLVVFFIIVTISFFSGFENSTNNFIFISIYLVFILVYIYYREFGFNSMGNIVIMLTILITIAAIQTIQVLNTTSNYARILAKNNEEVDVYGLSGGYGLVYSSVLSFFSFFILFLKSKQLKLNYKIRVLYIVTSLILLIFIWKAGYFLAVLLLILGFLFLLLGYRGFKVVKNFLFILFLFSFSFILKSPIENIILKKVKGTEYENKVIQLFATNSDSSIYGNEFDERNNRYKIDLELIKEYHIVGTWDIFKTGKHSFILDTLAQYGLILGPFLIYIVFFIPYRLLKYSDGIAFTFSIINLSILFVFLVLNSFTMALTPILLIIFPYTNYLLNQINEPV